MMLYVLARYRAVAPVPRIITRDRSTPVSGDFKFAMLVEPGMSLLEARNAAMLTARNEIAKARGISPLTVTVHSLAMTIAASEIDDPAVASAQAGGTLEA